jgi:hypothetical protein
VVWFQLLVGDVTRELPHGWAKELTVRYGVPAGHVTLIERCVGWFDDRPKDAGELLPLLREAAGLPAEVVTVPAAEPVAPAPDTARSAAVTPTTTGTRRTLLVSQLRRLCAAHRERDRLEHRPYGVTASWGLLVGLVFGWWVGEIAYAVRQEVTTFPNAFTGPVDRGAITIGMMAGLVAWLVYVMVVRFDLQVNATSAAKRRADRQAAELAREFPEEVASWGGAAVLREMTAVAELVAAVTPPDRPPSPTASLTPEEVTADPTRRAVLLGRLRDLDWARRRAADNLAGTWVGLAMLWVTAAPAAGGGVGYLIQRSLGKEYADLVYVIGTVIGVIVAAYAWVAMAAARRAVRRGWEATLARFAADYPRLVEGWGGPDVLRSPEAVAGLLRMHDPTWRPGLLRQWFGG